MKKIIENVKNLDFRSFIIGVAAGASIPFLVYLLILHQLVFNILK